MKDVGLVDVLAKASKQKQVIKDDLECTASVWFDAREREHKIKEISVGERFVQFHRPAAPCSVGSGRLRNAQWAAWGPCAHGAHGTMGPVGVPCTHGSYANRSRRGAS